MEYIQMFLDAFMKFSEILASIVNNISWGDIFNNLIDKILG